MNWKSLTVALWYKDLLLRNHYQHETGLLGQLLVCWYYIFSRWCTQRLCIADLHTVTLDCEMRDGLKKWLHYKQVLGLLLREYDILKWITAMRDTGLFSWPKYCFLKLCTPDSISIVNFNQCPTFHSFLCLELAHRNYWAHCITDIVKGRKNRFQYHETRVCWRFAN